MKRIAIFTGELSYSVRKGIVAIADARQDAELLVVVQRVPKNLPTLMRNQWRNLKRNGWRWIPYQIGELATRVHERLRGLPATVQMNWPGTRFTEEAISKMACVTLAYTPDIHGSATLERVRRFAPHLGVSLAAPILAPELFSIPGLGTLNLHKGKVPAYRGMPPAFWELWNDESEIGCTVHMVERALDTGAIVCESKIDRRPFSTLKALQLSLDELGVRLMTEAVRAMLDGTAAPRNQPPGGRTYRKPTLVQQRQLRTRLSISAGRELRTFSKDALFCGYAGIGGPLSRRLRGWSNRQGVVVLLYHRVNDDMRDSLTIGLEKFDAQMALLSRHCKLVDIREVVAGQIECDSRRPVVAVTFDDGYRDNYDCAVPILLRHRVPAAFFVSTGKIGVDGPFDHDLRRIGRGLPTMTWEQLSEMREAGFTIGSHSVTHLDCGRADLTQVDAELRESKATLTAKLGVDESIFAYPYGGRENMTPQALELVRAAGYRGCLSAYGGRNHGLIDPFDVRRVGINDNFTEWSFRARLEGWT